MWLIDWEQEILSRLVRFDFNTPPAIPSGLVEAGKWIAASQVQKSVRRNQLDLALKASFSLKHLDPQKLWNRLRVIVQEDCCCNLHLVGMVLWLAGKKAWRKNNGGEDKILAWAITELCHSEKSRVANDMLCLVNYHPDYIEACHRLADYSQAELEEVILNPDGDALHKVISAWYIAGIHKRSAYNLLERKGSPQVLISLLSHMGVPDWICDITRMGLGKGEGHAISLALAWLHQYNEKTQIIDECESPSIQIGEWNSEAYDIHTRTGGRAYNLFLKQNSQIKSFLNHHFKDKNHSAIIGHSVFTIEGHLINSRAIYPKERKLTHKALESYVDPNFIGDVRTDLTAMIEENFDKIHDARKALWEIENA